MTKDQEDILEWALRWKVPIYGGEVGSEGPDMTFVDNKRLAEIARLDNSSATKPTTTIDHFWFNVAKKMAAEIVDLRAELDEVLSKDRLKTLEINLHVKEIALQRKQLRNAWAKLGCRCIFNNLDYKIEEDSHCPYHGWYQQDPDGWDPLGVLGNELPGTQEGP